MRIVGRSQKMTLEANQKESKMMRIGENSPKSKVKVRSVRYVNEFAVVLTKMMDKYERGKEIDGRPSRRS